MPDLMKSQYIHGHLKGQGSTCIECLRTELATAKADLDHYDASCQTGHPLIQWHAEGDAVVCPLCTAKMKLVRLQEEINRVIAFPLEGYKRRTEEGYPMECIYDQFAYERMVDSYRGALRNIIEYINKDNHI